ncbi:retention module-containing protein [Shewanella sp. D64]|uniref:retention module-containing protein n=1 Tax=unclassified Shewanella TaxID=196818 RepID=UPI0022BA3F58|nr:MULTISPECIES: retention module-containing protein [unclassified Shewanella]MEC4726166.1 retention module-containing protein [Shewanella sp. D64]MEC4737918.1 retention module-containing protein [Shewanella sp. E94]WBJ96120.1 retention module-containing protein [Shewanella sp. MTB7]
MESLVTTQHGQVVFVSGKVTTTLDGITQTISSGESLPSASTLTIEDGAELKILYADDSLYSNTDSEVPFDSGALDEIEALQALIASGEDPTLDLPETAAGGANGNKAGSGYISVSRSGDETIASSGFNTSFENSTPLTTNLSLADLAPESSNNFSIAQFSDNFVNGIAYSTSSGLKGFTGDMGSDGSFAYHPGDTITFTIGNVTIASFSADAIQGTILFLQDIAGTSLSDSNMNYVENMAIFLQALDNDLSDGTDDGTLQTNSLLNLDTSYASNINIVFAIHELLSNYIDPTTGQPLNLATAGKEMLSLVLAELGIVFTRESELSNDGQNIFETLAMEHVADTIDELAGDGSHITTGNILDNDAGISGSTVISEVEGTTAINGIITVTTALGELIVYTQDTGDNRVGDYQYTLTSNNTEGDIASESFNYSLENALGDTSSANLTVNIQDDAPIVHNISKNLTTTADPVTTNLTLVLDVSGSMDNSAGNGKTYLETAIEALTALVNEVDATGNVNVQIVTFSSSSTSTGWLVDDIATVIDTLKSLSANGGTDYRDAINTVMNSGPIPVADQSLVYFISDGQPNSGEHVNTEQQDLWETYVTAN